MLFGLDQKDLDLIQVLKVRFSSPFVRGGLNYGF
jgi:hypothetical protein